MPATIVERPESRPGSGAPEKQHELIYKIKGATDDLDALAALYAQAPAIYNLLAARQGKVEPMATPGYYLGRMEYKPYFAPSATPRPETGDNITSFQIGGGTVKMYHAISHVGYYQPAGGASSGPNYHGAINVVYKDGKPEVQGVDLPQLGGAQIIDLTRYIADASFTDTYRRTVARLALRTNNAAFTIIGVAAFDEAECLFLGLDASQRGDGTDWEAKFQFAIAQNVADACSAWPAAAKPSVAVPRKGWQYLWTSYMDATDANALVPRVRSVNVEQVFYAADLTALNP